MGLSTSVHEIKNLVLSFHPVIVVETPEEERVDHLVEIAGIELGLPVFEWTVTRGLVQWPSRGVHRATCEASAMLAHVAGLTIEALFLLKDLPRHLTDPATARLFVELARKCAGSSSTLILSGVSMTLPPEMDHGAVHFDLALPGRKELRAVVGTVLRSLEQRHPALQRPEPGELDAILDALRGLTLNQARQAVARAVIEDGALGGEDVASILETKARAIATDGTLEYFPPDDNPFELGGFARLKRWLERARAGFSEEAKRLGLSPPRGILLVGVQGCGKSLAAKSIAREWRSPLLKLDAGRLYDKYMGETEKNLRKALGVAESMEPCVLWIDEIEKALSTGGSEYDGGVSRRVLATILTWLQEKREEVFVVATANDISALPPELLRKGRFDEIFFVDLPTLEERTEILRIHLENRKQDPEALDLAYLAEATEGWSGAEIEQAITAALYDAIHRRRPLDNTLLLNEITSTVPLSVSRREDVARLRATARARFVPVR
jgi:MoxR-like ATPase